MLGTPKEMNLVDGEKQRSDTKLFWDLKEDRTRSCFKTGKMENKFDAKEDVRSQILSCFHPGHNPINFITLSINNVKGTKRKIGIQQVRLR